MLFVPSISYPALVHLHPSGYNTELLENAASFPRYAYNHDSSEYTDSLQRQVLFQVSSSPQPRSGRLSKT